MSLLKELLDKVLSTEQETASSPEHRTLLDSVMGVITGGGLNSLLEGFRRNGLGEAVQSWIGSGSNAPVSGEQVRAALGDETIEEIAQKAGISKDEAANRLARVLPGIVDKLTPEGKLPDAEEGLADVLQSAVSDENR